MTSRDGNVFRRLGASVVAASARFVRALKERLQNLLADLLGQEAGDVVAPAAREIVGPMQIRLGLVQPALPLVTRTSSHRGRPRPGAVRSKEPAKDGTRFRVDERQ